MPADPIVLCALLVGVALGFLTYRLLRRSTRRRPAPAPSEQSPVLEEARKVRAESRETKVRIEANVTVGRPTAELFDKAMNLGRFDRPHTSDEGDERARGRKVT